MKVAFISGISWKGLSDIKGSTDHTLRTAVLNKPGRLSTDPCFAASSFWKILFPGLDSCLPKLNWGPCPWAPLGENSPPRKWCQRVFSVWEGRWGDRCFPFGTGNRLYLKEPDPLITLFDFVTHQLNMYSYPRKKSDIVSKKNNIGPFISCGLMHLTWGPQTMKSSPFQQNILWWKNCSMSVLSSQVASSFMRLFSSLKCLLCWALLFILI